MRDAIGLPDVRIVSAEPPDDGWPAGGLELCRAGRSTRNTEIVWDAGKLTITIRALASPDDCDLALRVAEGAARLAGAATVEADYFGAVDLADLRRLHTADWMREQAVSGARALATLIRDGRGPLAMPGPQRSCWIGARLLAELEAAGPAAAFADRVLETMRRVQWDIPAGFRDAGVFVSGGRGNGDGPGRETRFAVWLADENLVIPCVDYVALRVAEGEIVMVPFGAVAALAGTRGTLLDECQLLVRAMGDDDWADAGRARPPARGVATPQVDSVSPARARSGRPDRRRCVRRSAPRRPATMRAPRRADGVPRRRASSSGTASPTIASYQIARRSSDRRSTRCTNGPPAAAMLRNRSSAASSSGCARSSIRTLRAVRVSRRTDEPRIGRVPELALLVDRRGGAGGATALGVAAVAGHGVGAAVAATRRFRAARRPRPRPSRRPSRSDRRAPSRARASNV